MIPSRWIDRLPHRQPFLFLTEVIDVDPRQSGRGVWRVVGDEWFLSGHFPGQPVVPGVLIAEALAQLSGVVGQAESEGAGAADGSHVEADLQVLAHVDVRLKQSVVPPAEIELSTRVVRSMGLLDQFQVAATVASRRVAVGSLTLSRTAPQPMNTSGS